MNDRVVVEELGEKLKLADDENDEYENEREDLMDDEFDEDEDDDAEVEFDAADDAESDVADDADVGVDVVGVAWRDETLHCLSEFAVER